MNVTRLADVADVVNGFAFPLAFQGLTTGVYPFFKVGDMNRPENSETLTVAGHYVSDETRACLGLRVYPPGTIVFPKVGGALLTNKRRILGVPGTFDNNVMGIVPRTAHHRWLFHWFSTIDLAAIANVQALPSVRKSDVENLPVPDHDSAAQIRLAAALDAQLSTIEQARAAAQRRVEAAEALEGAILRDAFHGLTPVVIGAPLNEAPTGWQWRRLTDMARLESGHTPSRKHPEWWGGDIPWIALPDIRGLDGKVAMETKETTNALGIANSSARVLPAGTVVFSRTASVGFVTIMGREMATSQDFVNWVCGPDVSPRLLLHGLRASRSQLVAQASGAVHKTLYMPALKDFTVCLPAAPSTQATLAAQIDARLADSATLVTAARAELAAIEALPAAALRRVFGG